MFDIPASDAHAPVKRLFSSSASALAVYTNGDGDVVIRHRDVLEDCDTLMVIPPEFAARLAQAIGRAARRAAPGTGRA
ncbi:hypothetical protein JI739_01375 [Ramlibacter sp. AW1]|uniref:Uncharacterized protein n=1 Tax=Ramlibacter aurantiacus TaxID=2801330 RepID=A0A937D1P6_9BURK|nr:hypothetical protein [Ramlibacter aurantiacus]MBL0418985.1 hypothetical protein [Ramlibacter aurantiacus]